MTTSKARDDAGAEYAGGCSILVSVLRSFEVVTLIAMLWLVARDPQPFVRQAADAIAWYGFGCEVVIVAYGLRVRFARQPRG